MSSISVHELRRLDYTIERMERIFIGMDDEKSRNARNLILQFRNLIRECERTSETYDSPLFLGFIEKMY